MEKLKLQTLNRVTSFPVLLLTGVFHGRDGDTDTDATCVNNTFSYLLVLILVNSVGLWIEKFGHMLNSFTQCTYNHLLKFPAFCTAAVKP